MTIRIAARRWVTTYLRRKFKKNYSGIELEVNQKWVTNASMNKRIAEVLITSVRSVLGNTTSL